MCKKKLLILGLTLMFVMAVFVVGCDDIEDPVPEPDPDENDELLEENDELEEELEENDILEDLDENDDV